MRRILEEAAAVGAATSAGAVFDSRASDEFGYSLDIAIEVAELNR